MKYNCAAIAAFGRCQKAAENEKSPLRVRRPILPQHYIVVPSAMVGLTTEFGMGSGDPHLRGRTRKGH